MKLTNELKNKITKYFKNIKPEELKMILENFYIKETFEDKIRNKLSPIKTVIELLEESKSHNVFSSLIDINTLKESLDDVLELVSKLQEENNSYKMYN